MLNFTVKELLQATKTQTDYNTIINMFEKEYERIHKLNKNPNIITIGMECILEQKVLYIQLLPKSKEKFILNFGFNLIKKESE